MSTPPYPDITVGDAVIHGPGYVGSGAVRVMVRVRVRVRVLLYAD